ncbi:MAG: CPBP family intramembrane metalloprotease [Lachnospiraceae bacterium]
MVPQVIVNGTKNMNPLYLLIPLIPLMLFGGGLEEAGWRYILQPSLDKKYGYFLSCVIVAVIWSIWHLPLFFIKGTSQYSSDFWLFAISVLGLTFALGAIRKISGNVFLCVLFHCIHNAGSITFNLPDTLLGNSVAAVLLIIVSVTAVVFYEKNHHNDEQIK